MAGRSLLARFALDSREKRAWAMYDWANSAFWTTIIASVFPTYYKSSVAAGVENADASFAWATTAALIVIACMAPFLGALADYRAFKKKLLAGFAVVGALASAGMFFVYPGDWTLALILFGVGNIGASGSVIFYDALLPHVAKGDEVDRLSTAGFALGYAGGGLLLALNLIWISNPAAFGLPSGDGLSEAAATLPVRLAFLSVGIWWLLFTLPMLFSVKEPPADVVAEVRSGTLLGVTLKRLRGTLRELQRYGQAFRLLLAFLVYNDGILTIVRMAALYAASKELPKEIVLLTLLCVQFIGIPFAFLFGQLAARFGAKRLIFAGLAVYVFITVFAFFMTTATHFVILGAMVGMVQGGTQALSRSLFASMIPVRKSGEFFAFFSVGEKFAGLMGPALFALMITLTGSSDNAILSVSVFFVMGAWLLSRVNVAEGQLAVRAENSLHST